MNDNIKDFILYDDEFRNLIPPLSDEEYKQLEENCIRDGVRDPLVVWRLDDGSAFLIDGYNRSKIAMEHGLKVETRDMHFETRADALAWIVNNQLGRRNLEAYERSALALKLKPVIAEKAKENLVTHTDTGYQGLHNSAKAIDTRAELAKIAGVSHDTIRKVEMIEKKASEKTKQLVREGKLSINQAYNSVHEKRPDPVEVAKEEHKKFEQDKAKHVVSLKDAQTDKINQKIIDNALMQEFLKLLNSFDSFMLTHDVDDLTTISDQIPDDEVNTYVERFENIHTFLMIIRDKMIWR